MTQAQVDAHHARLRHRAAGETSSAAGAAERETGPGGLQKKIQDWCDAQWPRWVCDFPRTDKPSTVAPGRHDATVWGPHPVCLLIETKAKGKKQTPDQLVWAARMRAIGWEVSVVYSLEQFVELTNEKLKNSGPRTPDVRES